MSQGEVLPARLLSAVTPRKDTPGAATFAVTREVDAASFAHALVPSKPAVARLFAQGLLVDEAGRALARTTRLAAGDAVTVVLPPAEAEGPVDHTSVEVLYQDAFLLAANKPAGLLVHGDGNGAETLTDRVRGHLAAQGVASEPQALHRLDVDTSGIVFFSLVKELQPALDALVAGDGLTKRYHAVVAGELPRSRTPWLEVEAPIARDRHDARRMRVGATGKPAHTRLRTVRGEGGLTLVEAELVTGRRHQIRVHLAHLGLPIVGDALYGGRRCGGGLMLHAHEALLTHPFTNDGLVIEAPCPERFVLQP